LTKDLVRSARELRRATLKGAKQGLLFFPLEALLTCKQHAVLQGNVVTKEDREKFAQLVNSLLSEELGQLVDKIQKECPEAINELVCLASRIITTLW